MLLCMLLFVVGLRALIPLGYMPDTAALRQGVLRIALCTSTGALSTVRVVLDGLHHGGHHDGHGVGPIGAAGAQGGDADHDHAAGAECPFWVAAHTVLHQPPAAIPLLLAAIVDTATPLASPPNLAPLPPAGPPLGSRAPPTPAR
jgi:hypothetical protein